ANGLDGESAPFPGWLSTGPRPLAKSTIVSPGLAGLLTTGVPSACAAAKTPGEYAPTGAVIELLNVPLTGEFALVPFAVAPLTITVNGVVPSPIPSSHGTRILI